MIFGLINVGATFQRAMDIAFQGLINRSIVVYMDDIIVFSSTMEEHESHLRRVLNGL